MGAEPRPRSSSAGVVAVGAAAFAVVCCASLPLVTAALGGITLAAALGVGAGVVVLSAGAILGLILLRASRRRDSDTEERT